MKSMSGEGKTPLRNIRVPDDLWKAYKENCEANGTNPSEDLREYMRSAVEGDND